MAFENYQDMRVGDVIECYRVEHDSALAVSPHTHGLRGRPPTAVPRTDAASSDRRGRMAARNLPDRRYLFGMTMSERKSWHDANSAIRVGGASQRQLRVGELVRHALAEMLTRGDVHDPVIEGHLITIPEVRMTADLRLATIYVMPLGGRDAERRASRRSQRNAKFLRGEIARRVNLKFAPEIRFRVDERFDEAERIEKLLRTPAVRRDIGGKDSDE